eukprot:scaffold3791_cov390-Prasinococcus_capsulatus_cf.AAC.1
MWTHERAYITRLGRFHSADEDPHFPFAWARAGSGGPRAPGGRGLVLSGRSAGSSPGPAGARGPGGEYGAEGRGRDSRARLADAAEGEGVSLRVSCSPAAPPGPGACARAAHAPRPPAGDDEAD